MTSEVPCQLIWIRPKSEKDSSSPTRVRRPLSRALPSRQSGAFRPETEEDRVKDLAEAELKNLWEATEVIDMDKV
ncbi:hypothetical protein EMGBD2_01420 [Nitrospirota bacterium]|nr:hypothetical protein EMGBD2_01420 [Nitrospirota bacterium]